MQNRITVFKKKVLNKTIFCSPLRPYPALFLVNYSNPLTLTSVDLLTFLHALYLNNFVLKKFCIFRVWPTKIVLCLLLTQQLPSPTKVSNIC